MTVLRCSAVPVTIAVCCTNVDVNYYTYDICVHEDTAVVGYLSQYITVKMVR